MAGFSTVVMAAGKGTRMRSKTPKVLSDLCGRPLVAWPVQAALDAGADEVVVVRSPDVPLEQALPAGVRLATQVGQDGTGGAVAAGLAEVKGDGPIVVLSGDVPLISADTIAEIVEAHSSSGAAATMVTTVLDDPSGYGRVVRDESGDVLRVVETKSAGDATDEELAIAEVNTGIFCFSKAELSSGLPQVTADNAQGEYYLPDVLPLIRQMGGRVTAHAVADQAVVLGVNDQVQLAQVAANAQRLILERHMLAGVRVIDPERTRVDAAVTIASDVTLEPDVQLLGSTSVGSGTLIGAGSTLIDTSVGTDAVVRQSHCDGASVGDGVSVGPFAYLRPGAELQAGAKAGTFVEIKNSVIGEGSKVPHLSYIGDADVGPGTNLGAGTITANYDGKTKKKSRTTIGPEVRTGVLTALVAPVELGTGAYTAAGSVIVDDVPEGALGVARSRQQNIDGYNT